MKLINNVLYCSHYITILYMLRIFIFNLALADDPKAEWLCIFLSPCTQMLKQAS